MSQTSQPQTPHSISPQPPLLPRTFVRLFLLLLLLPVSAFALPGHTATPVQKPAAQPAPTPQPQVASGPPAIVYVGDQPVFTIHAAIGPFSAADRAAAATARLNQFTRDVTRSPKELRTADHPGATDIVAGDLILTTITDADAFASGHPRNVLAETYLHILRDAVVKVRGEYTPRSILFASLKAVLVTLILGVLLVLFRRLFPALYRAIERARGRHIRTLKVQSLELLSEGRIVELLLQLARLVRFAVTALLLYFYIPLVFSFFPWTRSFGATLLGYIVTPVRHGWIAFVNYLPDLLVVLLVFFFAFIVLRIASFIFREIGRGTISWPGFYPEWAMPTHKIVQLLILAFAVVIVFPYLPGSSSPAFRGVSIFLGVLLSLGSSSAVANIVSGVLLTYTRAFHDGDRVQIADTVGDVVDKGLLATQIRTIKNELVTIPNSLVLGSHIINFSRSMQTQPLILHATVSIGYDAPWREVHTLLIAAAAATEGILADPAPFVLQTSLDDFYVSYQINACTRDPARMAVIYSDLNQNIQDRFNEAGVEIMSPHYSGLRDGNTIAIPEQYRPQGYEPDSFRITKKP